MHVTQIPGQRASTTFGWRFVKLAGLPPQVGGESLFEEEASHPERRNRRAWSSLQFRFRGGAESSWLVRAGGCTLWLPGWLCIEDSFALVLQEGCKW